MQLSLLGTVTDVVVKDGVVALDVGKDRVVSPVILERPKTPAA